MLWFSVPDWSTTHFDRYSSLLPLFLELFSAPPPVPPPVYGSLRGRPPLTKSSQQVSNPWWPDPFRYDTILAARVSHACLSETWFCFFFRPSLCHLARWTWNFSLILLRTTSIPQWPICMIIHYPFWRFSSSTVQLFIRKATIFPPRPTRVPCLSILPFPFPQRWSPLRCRLIGGVSPPFFATHTPPWPCFQLGRFGVMSSAHWPL